MRSFLLGLAAGQVGHVEFTTNAPQTQVSDKLLGQVLADQLRVAPKISQKAEAELVSQWSDNMFEKPATVFLAVLDGADSNGVALQSHCTPSKECVGETCYGSTAACVVQNLMSQSETALPQDLATSFLDKTVVGISSGSEAQNGVTMLMQDKDNKVMAVAHNFELSAKEPLDLAQVGPAVARLQQAAPAALVELNQQDLKVTVGKQSASFDTSQSCVRLMLGEALSIAEAPTASLVVLTPRAGGCMREQYGAGSAEASVASSFLATAVKVAQSKVVGKTFTAVVSLPTTSASAGMLAAEAPAAAFIQRRLQGVEQINLASKAAEPIATGLALSAVYNIHIYGWTSLIMFFALLAAAYSILGMTNDRDPLLYAKFRPEVDPSSRR